MIITKNIIINNIMWKFSERILSQLITFIVSMVLARILDPADYSVIAIINIFIALANTLVTSGFNSALIQKQNTDEIDYSSVFYLNLVLSFIIYIILFGAARAISHYYEIPELYIYLRVLCLQIIIYAFNTIQQAYVSKKMIFKRYFISTVGGNIFSGIIGILMALKGYGAWALVAQSLISSVVNAGILWITIKWRPKWMFSFHRLWELFNFGWKMLCSALLASGYEQLSGLIIGKSYSSTDLVFYNRGYNFPSLLVTNINSSINSVLFPAIANVQDNIDRCKTIMRRGLQLSLYILTPALIGMAVVAKPFVTVFLTDKWIMSVPYLRLFCIYFLIGSIQNTKMSGVQAMGLGSLFLKIEIGKDIIGIMLMIVFAKYSVLFLAFSVVLTCFIITVITSIFIKHIFQYTLLEQFKDIIPSLVMSSIMGGVIYLLKFYINNQLILLLSQILLGIVTYVVLSILFRPEALTYLIKLLKEKFK